MESTYIAFDEITRAVEWANCTWALSRNSVPFSPGQTCVPDCLDCRLQFKPIGNSFRGYVWQIIYISPEPSFHLHRFIITQLRIVVAVDVRSEAILVSCIIILSMIGFSMSSESVRRRDQGGQQPPAQPIEEVGLTILTLNCWGVPFFGSADIAERFQLIGRHFAAAEKSYDVLLFQEVWRDADYRTLADHLRDNFPHFHYFYRYVCACRAYLPHIPTR